MENETTQGTLIPESQREEARTVLDRAQSALDRSRAGTISAPSIESASRLNIPEVPKPAVSNKIIADTPIPAEEVEVAPQDKTISSDAEELRNTLASRQDILSELGLDDIKDSFEQLLQKGAFTQQAEDEAGIDDKTTSLNEINSQLRETDLKFKRERELIEDAPGLTAAQKSARLGDVSRKQARELADLSIISATRRDDLTTAQALVDRKVELTFEPIQQKLQFQQFLFNENKELFTLAEQRQFDKNVKKEDAKIAKEKEEMKTLEDTKLDLAMTSKEKGGSNAEISAIMQSGSVEDAIKAANSIREKATGVSVGTGTVYIDNETGLPITKLDPQQVSAMISTTANLETTVAGKKAVQAQLEGFIKNGDYASAYNQIANTVANGLPAENSNRFQSARIDIEVLGGLKSAVQAFADAGGDTGLLTGKAEEINRKLGRVTDPALTELAVQLQREFQTYRNVMTGAAFTPEESREYASVNPTTGKSIDLNLSVINGALNQLDNRVTGTINAVVPQAGQLRDILNAPKEVQQNKEQLKKQVNDIYISKPQARSIIDSLFNNGEDDGDVLEYLRIKGII